MKRCGECKYNEYETNDTEYAIEIRFYCGNEYSDNYGYNTAYSDSCEDYEEKDREWMDELKLTKDEARNVAKFIECNLII